MDKFEGEGGLVQWAHKDSEEELCDDVNRSHELAIFMAIFTFRPTFCQIRMWILILEQKMFSNICHIL